MRLECEWRCTGGSEGSVRGVWGWRCREEV